MLTQLLIAQHLHYRPIALRSSSSELSLALSKLSVRLTRCEGPINFSVPLKSLLTASKQKLRDTRRQQRAKQNEWLRKVLKLDLSLATIAIYFLVYYAFLFLDNTLEHDNDHRGKWKFIPLRYTIGCRGISSRGDISFRFLRSVVCRSRCGQNTEALINCW